MAAKSLEDAEFWLPSEFLSEEDLLMDRESFKKNNSLFNFELKPSHCFPDEFPFEFDSFGTNSALSSPVGSVAGSTETESSDEEDFLAGLTRRLAHSSLNDVHKRIVPSFAHDQHEKYWSMSGSPQSTLSGLGSLSASSNGSPNGPSQVPSPPTTPFGAKNDTWDLIYAAAGQVARLKMSQQGRPLMEPHRSFPSHPVSVPSFAKNPNTPFFSDNTVNHTNQYQQVSRTQMFKQETSPAWTRQGKLGGWPAQPQIQQQIQSRGRTVGYENTRCGHYVGLGESAWSPMQGQTQHHQPTQQATASGMRAVFLNGSDVKKKSTGTGVFLPRRYGSNPVEPRKKSGCSTVLIPPKVVQALNLSFDEMSGQAQPRFNPAGYSQIHVDGMVAKSNGLLTQQRRSLRHEGPLNHELRLPQEWTY